MLGSVGEEGAEGLRSDELLSGSHQGERFDLMRVSLLSRAAAAAAAAAAAVEVFHYLSNIQGPSLRCVLTAAELKREVLLFSPVGCRF